MNPRTNRFFLFVLFFALWVGAAAKDIPPPPKPPRLVNDFTGLLSSGEREALEQKLVAYDDSTSTQIAIVIEESLEGDDIFDYSYRLAEEWGIGRQGKNNGILIYVALGDRKLRIQTGYGAEGFLPDAMAKRIIDQIIAPNFRSQNYYNAFDKATDVIIQLGNGEFVNDEIGEGSFPIGAVIFIVIFLVIIILISFGGRGGGGYHRGGRYDSGGGWLIFGPGSGSGWGSGGGSDWGGGGFGGGGFGGFGGGGFGGGGAGGSW